MFVKHRLSPHVRKSNLTMSSDKRNLGAKKISFDPNTKGNVGIQNGIGLAGKPGLKPPGKRTQVIQIKAQSSSRTELGSPWGVALKPIPSIRKIESQTPPEQPVPTKPNTKLIFKGPHSIEQIGSQKSELKEVNHIRNKAEVRIYLLILSSRTLQ